MSTPQWGEVWDVDFGNPVGHEQGKQRPAVVVTANWFNQTRAELHFVVPISSTIRAIGTHYRIDAPSGGLDIDSEAMCEHLRSVSRNRFVRKRGDLERSQMDEIAKRIKLLILEVPPTRQRNRERSE
jgi:mRNA interferase MazF